MSGRGNILVLIAFSFVEHAAAQGWGIQWECDPTEKHHRFYRADLGVVCWDGNTYSKDNGGIPQYMLDYFEQNRRMVQEKVKEMNHHIAELKAARASNSGAPRLSTGGANARPTVAREEAIPTVPVNPEVFAGIAVGTGRATVLDKLGKPAGSITIPGDDGLIEIWTYQLADGSTAKLKLMEGVVTSREPQKAEHAR